MSPRAAASQVAASPDAGGAVRALCRRRDLARLGGGEGQFEVAGGVVGGFPQALACPGRGLAQFAAQPHGTRAYGRVLGGDRLALLDEPLPHGCPQRPYVGLVDLPCQLDRLVLEGRAALVRGAGQPPGPQSAYRGPQDRAVQRMGESYGALVVDVDQAVGLQAFEDAQVEVVGGRRQGVGEGEEFEGLALVGVDAADDVSRAFAHGRGQGQRAAPGLFVRARDSGQQALFAQRAGQVAQQPEVAVAQSVQPVHGERLQSATGTRCGQPVRLLVRQRLQGEAGQQLTGPQPGHRAGHRYVVRGHDQQPGAALHRQLVDQGGRGVVEEVCVVDEQGPYGGEQLDRLVQGDRLGQQVRERGEGDVPGLGRGKPPWRSPCRGPPP